MRIDKFLKLSRLIKRRSVAAGACDGGRVKVNGKPAKPATNVSEGDRIEISFGDRTLTAEVLSVREVVKKEEAAELYKLL